MSYKFNSTIEPNKLPPSEYSASTLKQFFDEVVRRAWCIDLEGVTDSCFIQFTHDFVSYAVGGQTLSEALTKGRRLWSRLVREKLEQWADSTPNGHERLEQMLEAELARRSAIQ
jgi:hypothetical protein